MKSHHAYQLAAMGSRIELADGKLVFVFSKLFQAIADAKSAAEQAIPRLGKQNGGFVGFHELKEPVLSQAVSVWSSLLEQVRKVAEGHRAVPA